MTKDLLRFSLMEPLPLTEGKSLLGSGSIGLRFVDPFKREG